MEFDEMLSALSREGALFATAINAVGVDAPVPTCPEWTVRDLVLHQGEVHRWAATVVAGAIPKPSAVPDDVVGEVPTDDMLADWLIAGLDGLIRTLRAAPADLAAFTFLNDAPPARKFWARRQLHETEMHRVDAESAAGAFTPFEPASAEDGVDEMLTGFAPRKHTPLHADGAHTLQIELTDSPRRWRMTISEEPPRTDRLAAGDDSGADCTVSGTAADMYRALWNRADGNVLAVRGDRSVLDLFRSSVKIRWS